MDLSRRGFLAALAGAFVADPERLLWVPGKKLISIPRPRVLSVAETIQLQINRIRPELAGLLYMDRSIGMLFK